MKSRGFVKTLGHTGIALCIIGLVLVALVGCPSPATSSAVVKYTVTYDKNDDTVTGTAPADTTRYVSGAEVTLKAKGDLVKTGKIFDGWTVKADGSGPVLTPGAKYIIPAKDVTFHAKWIPTFTVTYDKKGATGTLPADTTRYVSGAEVTLKAKGDLVKTGKIFEGWTVKDDGTGLVLTPGAKYIIPAKDVTFHAKWIPTFTVTYDKNGATGGTALPDVLRYAEGAEITLAAPGDLVKTGDTPFFAGWTVLPDGSGSVLKPGAKYIIPAKDVTFHAKWIPTPVFTVTYDKNGATGGEVLTDTTRYATGASVTLKTRGTLVKTGVTPYFAGWTEKKDGSGPVYKAAARFTMGEADVTFYAKWIPTPVFTVTYDKNGATGGTAPTDTTRYATGAEITLAGRGDLVKTGHTFKGWTVKKDGSGTVLTEGGNYVMPKADVTFYAKWEASVFSVTYDGNGSTSGTAPTDISKYTTGAEITLAGRGDLVKTGHTFDGWTVNAAGTGTVYNQGDMYRMGTATVTFYAKWEVTRYSVFYNTNGATSGNAPRDNNQYPTGSQVRIMAHANSLLKREYRFAGWTTNAAGIGTVYNDNEIYTMGKADVTFYARWEVIRYFVFYNANGATSGNAPRDNNQYLTGNQVRIMAHANSLLKREHRFAGWTTNAAGTGKIYYDNETYTMGEANVTFYARWTRIYQFQVIYDGNGADNDPPVDPTSTAPNYPHAIIGKGNLRKAGKTFAGWTMNAAGTGTLYNQGDVYTMGNIDVILYAKWK